MCFACGIVYSCLNYRHLKNVHLFGRAQVVFCIGSTFQCLASSIFTLTVGRAIGGYGIGALRSAFSPVTCTLDDVDLSKACYLRFTLGK